MAKTETTDEAPRPLWASGFLMLAIPSIYALCAVVTVVFTQSAP